MAEAEIRSLGLKAPDRIRLARTIQQGVTYARVRRLHEWTQLSERRLAQVAHIKPRTWERRKQAGKFTPEESDRLARIARLMDLAVEVLGSREAGIRWLQTPNLALGGAAPLDMGSTDIGAAEVEATLVRIEHGVYA